MLTCQGNVILTSTIVDYGDSTKPVNTTNLPGTASVLWDLNDEGFYNDASCKTVAYFFTWGTTFRVSLDFFNSSGNRFYSDSTKVVRYTRDLRWILPGPLFVPVIQRYADLSYIIDSGPLFYLWNFNSGSKANSRATLVFQYPVADNHNIKLWVSSADGCADSLQKSVMIYPTPVASFI